jgi:hypothetical protein
MQKRTILKEAVVLLIAAVMILSSVVAVANTEESPDVITNLGAMPISEEETQVQSDEISSAGPQKTGYRDLIWDNGDPDFVNGVCCQRIGSVTECDSADDFTLTEDTTIEGLVWQSVDDTTYDWQGLDDLIIYEDAGGMPGAELIDLREVPNTRVYLGEQWSRPWYEYTIDLIGQGLEFTLPAGTYFLLLRPYSAGTSGQSFWLTSPAPGGSTSSIWFRSAYFGYPDWVPGSYPFGADYDVNFKIFGTAGGGTDIIWDNGPDTGSAFSSQRDYAYPFISQVADDFMFVEDAEVWDVHWWGNFWGGDPIDPMDFEIIFYADDGTGTAPTGGGSPDPTGTALAYYFFPGVTGLPLSGNGNYEYHVDLPMPFYATGGVKYWIAIVAVFDFPPQWGWTNTDVIQLSSAVQGFPLLAIPFWTPLDLDMAFYLTGTTTEPPEASIDVEKYVKVLAEGEYELWLYDSFGDGWDYGYGGPNYLDLYINGVLYGTYTQGLYDPNPIMYPFAVAHGDEITTIYRGYGYYQAENEYWIIDAAGNEVWHEGAGYNIPGNIPPGTLYADMIIWVDADTEGEAVDQFICDVVEYKLVIHNDGEVPIYSLYVYDYMSEDSLELLDWDIPPDYIYGNYVEWYGGYSIPYVLYPCETIEIHLWAHVLGPHCSNDENYLYAEAFADVEPYYVWDDDYAWIHCVEPDGVPPVTTIDLDGTVGDNSWYVSDVEITISATDDNSGVAATYYSLDGAAYEMYTGPITVSDDGEHTIAAYSVDNAGNVEDPPVEDEFKIDQTDPTIELEWDADNNKLIADPNDATSGVASVEFFVNGASIGTVTSSPWEMEHEPESGDTAYAVVTDNAGNTATSDTIDSHTNAQTFGTIVRRIIQA